jgi:ketosteroid isomerase-like protein
MSSGNLSVVQQVYASFAAGDVAAILASLTADVRWEVIGPPDAYPLFGTWTGPAEVAAFFQGVGENEDFTDFSPRRFLADGDTVVVLGHAAYRLKRTGAPVDTDWVHVFALRDGKVSGFQEYADSAQIAARYRAAAP